MTLKNLALAFLFTFIALIIKPDDLLAQARPNFVVIQADDLSTNIFNSKIRNGSKLNPAMPALFSRVAKNGANFNNFYVNQPLCSPSRASLLSGRMTHNHGMLINSGKTGGYNYWRNSNEYKNNLATWLDKAGYRTSHFGKFMNGYGEESKPLGWDRWVTQLQLGRFYQYQFNIDGKTSRYFGSYNKKDKANCRVALPGTDNFCKHSTDLTTAYAVSEIKRKTKDPLYLQIDFFAPHEDGVGSPGPEPQTRLKRLYNNVSVPKYADSPESLQNKPFFIKELKTPSSSAIKEMQARLRNEVLSMRGMDQGINRILNALKSTGKLNNTYFIFTSDNGFFAGEHRVVYGKYLAQEPALKQPLLIRGPEVKTNLKPESPASTIDIAPTILNLARVQVPSSIDGISLVSTLKGQGDLDSRVVPVEGFTGGSLTDPPQAPTKNPLRENHAPVVNWTGFVSGKWKYIFYYNNEEELYNIKEDPREINNLAPDPDYSQVLEWSRDLSQRLRSCKQEECRSKVVIPPSPKKTVNKLAFIGLLK